MSVSKQETLEIKARALEEAARDCGGDDTTQFWLNKRANEIREGRDPGVPEEPLVAGSRARARDGRMYLRWSDDGRISEPWLDPSRPFASDNLFTYDELDIVQTWPATSLPLQEI